MAADKAKRRLTKQKSAILEYLKNTKTHPDAEKIYTDLKPKNTSISLSTVYRNLSQMSEDGLIIKLASGTKSDHFDGDTLPHNHFICNECGKIIDVYCNTIFPKEDVGTITSFSVYFYGICKECKKAKKQF